MIFQVSKKNRECCDGAGGGWVGFSASAQFAGREGESLEEEEWGAFLKLRKTSALALEKSICVLPPAEILLEAQSRTPGAANNRDAY